MELPRILVVDDEASILDVLRRLLEADGWQVSLAQSAPAALEQLRAGPFHLLITDIVMSGMDGMELARKARELYPDLDVIIMTSFPTLETSLQSLGLGVVNYLLKPLSAEALQVTVWSWWREWFARRSLERSRAALEKSLEGLLGELGALEPHIPAPAKARFAGVMEQAGVLGGLVGDLETTVQALSGRRRPQPPSK